MKRLATYTSALMLLSLGCALTGGTPIAPPTTAASVALPPTQTEGITPAAIAPTEEIVPAATPTALPTPTPPPSPALSESEGATPAKTYQLTPLTTAVVTTSEEDGGARPEIALLDNQFKIAYRDTLTREGHFLLKALDLNLEPTGVQSVLVSTDESGGVTDIRLTSDGQFVYAAYEKSSRNGRSLFLEKYDASFNRLASQLVATVGKPGRDVEALDDPPVVLAAERNRVYVLTKIRGGYRMREFDLSLNPTDQTFEVQTGLDMGVGGVPGALFLDGFFYLVTTVHVAGTPLCPQSDPSTNNDLVVLQYNPDWTPTGRQQTIADTSEIERYPTGFKYMDGKFYVTYIDSDPQTDTIECGTADEQIGVDPVRLRVLDRGCNLLAETPVTDVGDTGNYPTVEVLGERIYIAYGHKEAQGLGPGRSKRTHRPPCRTWSVRIRICTEP